MSVRNDILEGILVAEGGSPGVNDSMGSLLSKTVIAAAGTVTVSSDRNSLLNDYLVAKGGARVVGTRNDIIREIIDVIGCLDPGQVDRNLLLQGWQACLEDDPVTYDSVAVTYAGNGEPILYNAIVF